MMPLIYILHLTALSWEGSGETRLRCIKTEQRKCKTVYVFLFVAYKKLYRFMYYLTKGEGSYYQNFPTLLFKIYDARIMSPA